MVLSPYMTATKPARTISRELTPEAAPPLMVMLEGGGTSEGTWGTDPRGCVGPTLAMVLLTGAPTTLVEQTTSSCVVLVEDVVELA